MITSITSIRAKMLVLLGATVGITLIAFSASIYLVMTTHLVDRQKDHLVQLADEKKSDLADLFADRKKIFELLALGHPVEVFADKYQEGILIEHFRQHSGVFPVLSFSDFLGRETLRIDSGRLDDKTRDLSVHSAFLKAVDRPGTVCHESLEKNPEGGSFLQLFFARRSFFDEDLGVIGAEMPLETLTVRLRGFTGNDRGFLALLDGEGRLLFRSDKEDDTPHRWRGKAAEPPFLAGAPAPPAGSFRRHVDGTDSLVALSHFPELDVTVVAVQPYSEVLSGLRQFNIMSLALSLVIVALGTNMALAVANSLIKPLESLRAATDDIAAGNTARTAEVTTRDEIGKLAESFNRMGRSLHESYEELEKKNIELVKLDHMKDALISDVSHELKTPVAKQVMQLEMLNHEVARVGGPNEQMRSILQVMEENIRRQQNVIRNILMVSRLEAGGRELVIEKVRLDNILEDVIADHIHLISTYGIRLEQNMREETVDSDREMLWHVFSNCIGNAIKYRSVRDPEICVTVGGMDGVATVRFEDNGIGLTEEEAETAFKRFFQSTPTSEGIGLGLSISRSIVEMMGGTIRIESPGRSRGATVTVTLPLSET